MYFNFKPLIFSVQISMTRCMALLLLVVLSGCGGSSGNSEPTAIIDSDNATAIVRAVALSAFELEEVGELSYLGDLGMLDTTSRSALNKSSRIALRTVIEPQTEQCLVSGSLTISGNIQGTDSLTAGDVITLEADQCNNGENDIVDGKMQMTISKLTGDLSSNEFLLGVKVIFTNFSVTESSEEAMLNGDINITLEMTASTTQIQLSGNSLTVSSLGETQSLSNFSNTYTVDASASPVTWTYDCKGNIDSSEFLGTINYQMPVKFAGSGESYPDSGELLITGANNATLRLITLDNVYIQIDADYDGDGVIDETFYMTWAELAE